MYNPFADVPRVQDWLFCDPANIARYPGLFHAREVSCRIQSEMRACLTGLELIAPEVATVAVSGSIGRLEAMAHSDCDLVVILANDVDLDSEGARRAMTAVWDTLAPLNLRRPKSTGIYASPGSHAQLCNPESIGKLSEDVDVFGKRIQYLLDAYPVFGFDAHARLVQAIIDHYATGFVEHDSGKEWVYLMNDLIRYFRSCCVWRQFDFSNDNQDGWYIRNAKQRNSRVLMYAGLLLLLGECSKVSTDKPEWLFERLPLTALERVAAIYTASGDRDFHRIAEPYDRFLSLIGDETFRETMIRSAPGSLAELGESKPAAFNHIHDCGSELMAELLRFTLDRRDDWSPRFFEYLLF